MTRLKLSGTALLLALGAAGCATSGAVPSPFPGAARTTPVEETSAPVRPPEGETARLALITTALDLRGVPYRNGGSDPAGFDCSGFVQYVFRQHGTSLPREVRDQYRFGHLIDPDGVRAGDLLFFETVTRGPSHVGVAIGGGRFVHAPSSRGVVRVERYTDAYWSKRFIGARRLL